MGAPGVRAGGRGLLGCGLGLRMRWVDWLANFGPLQLDLNCAKLCKGKTVNLGGVFCLFGGLMGAPGATAGQQGLLGHG